MPTAQEELARLRNEQETAQQALTRLRGTERTRQEFDRSAGLLGLGAVNPVDFAEKQAEKKRAAVARQSAINSATGGAFDPNSKFDGFLLTADMVRSNRLDEQQAKFKARFPEGTMLSVPDGSGGHVLVGRKAPEDMFRTIGGAGSVAGAVVSEPVIAGAAGEALGPLGVVAGTFGGAMLQSEVERRRGFEFDNRGQALGGAIGEGAIAGAMSAVAGKVLRGLRIVKDPNNIGGDLPPLSDAIISATEEGLAPLVRGQTSRSPVVRGLFSQAGGAVDTPKRVFEQQSVSLLKKFREIANAPLDGVSDENLARIILAQKAELDAIARPAKAVSATDFQRGAETFRRAGREWVARKYERAHSLADDVVYDIGEAQALNREIQKGVIGAGAPEQQPSTIVGLDGLPAFAETAISDVRVSGSLTPELQAISRDIASLDQIISQHTDKTGEVFTAFEQIKALRTRLFDLKEASDGEVRSAAKRLWGALSNAMDAPISGSKEFLRAHRAAAKAHAFVEGQLEKTFVAGLIRTDTPERIVRRLGNPGNFQELRTLKRLLPPKDFRVVQEAFRHRVMNASAPGRMLDRFADDQKTLDLLIPKREQAALRAFGKRKQEFNESVIHGMTRKQKTARERSLALLDSGTEAQVKDVVDLAGGVDSDFAVAGRAAVYEKLLGDATVRDEFGVELLSPARLMNSIEKLKKSGHLNALFRPQDWKRLENFEVYSSVISTSMDVGGQLAAGAMRSQARKSLTDRSAAERLVVSLVQYATVGRILASPSAYPIILRSGLELNEKKVRGLTTALTIAALEQRQARAKEQEN